jgi:glycosyltransferase involved in cell wall biosynthesis
VSDPEARISVALCTYNGASYVEEQLTSVLHQRRRPHEIVISDDASTDDTIEVIERTLAARAGTDRPDVRILRNAQPLGVTANFERALAATTGELIALCDQDDVWHPAKLERLAGAFGARSDLLLVHSDARLTDAAGRPTGRTLFETLGVTADERRRVHRGEAFGVLMRRNIVTGATAMVRRELVERSVPFPEAWVHDEWLAVVGASTGAVDLVEEPLIDYRQHGANQIGATSLTGMGRVQRLRAPRSRRNATLLERARALAERMPLLRPEPSSAVRRRAEEKLEHELVRSALPASRLRRPWPVLREWRTGRYSTCGLGVQDVVRDLVQPAR